MANLGVPKYVRGDFGLPLCIYSKRYHVLVACKAKTIWPDDVELSWVTTVEAEVTMTKLRGIVCQIIARSLQKL